MLTTENRAQKATSISIPLMRGFHYRVRVVWCFDDDDDHKFSSTVVYTMMDSQVSKLSFVIY